MPRKPKPYIFDSWSLIAYLDGGDIGGIVANLIGDAQENRSPLYMTVLDAVDIWEIIARTTSADEATKCVDEFTKLGFEILDITWAIARAAAVIRMNYKIDLKRSLSVAYTKHLKAELVTGDVQYKKINDEIKIRWVSDTD